MTPLQPLFYLLLLRHRLPEQQSTPGPPATPAVGIKILLNNGLKAPNVTIAKINIVNNLPNNSLIAEFSYHGTSITCKSSTNSPDDIVIESPLFSLKPIASLTKPLNFLFLHHLFFVTPVLLAHL